MTTLNELLEQMRHDLNINWSDETYKMFDAYAKEQERAGAVSHKDDMNRYITTPLTIQALSEQLELAKEGLRLAYKDGMDWNDLNDLGKFMDICKQLGIK
jgi:hypothetical protein